MIEVIATGAVNWDTNIWVNDFAAIGEEVPVSNITRVPGGKAANVAVAAAGVSDRNRVALFGALGDDDIGKKQLEILGKEEVNVSYIKVARGFESGQAYITVDRNGSNFIETYFGANNQLLPEDLLEPLRLSVISDCRVIAVSDPPVPTAEMIVRLGDERGVTVLYDAGTRLQAGLNKLGGIFGHTSIFVLNSVESLILIGSANPLDVRRKLKQYNPGIGVVVKMGEKGCAYAGGHDETLRLPALPLGKLGMKVLNTTGCGDSFLGVFAASLAQSFSIEQSLERATVAGGLKATKAETRCRLGRESLEETLKLWRKVR